LPLTEERKGEIAVTALTSCRFGWSRIGVFGARQNHPRLQRTRGVPRVAGISSPYQRIRRRTPSGQPATPGAVCLQLSHLSPRLVSTAPTFCGIGSGAANLSPGYSDTPWPHDGVGCDGWCPTVEIEGRDEFVMCCPRFWSQAGRDWGVCARIGHLAGEPHRGGGVICRRLGAGWG
jgi:hypothetical protein